MSSIPDNFDVLMQQSEKGYYGDCNDDKREYTKFLGLAVESFDGNIGWEGSNSTLEVTVYEDICNGINFGGMDKYAKNVQTGGDLLDINGNPIIIPKIFNVQDMIGAPYQFRLGQFEFCGLLQGINKRTDESGTESFRISLKSPDEILDGIQLILGGYYAEQSVQNIYNLSLEIEQQKSYYFQLEKELNNEFNEYIRITLQQPVYQTLIEQYGPEYVIENRISNLNEYRRLWDQREEVRRQISSYLPSIYGSMYYNEIVWAFNKLQDIKFKKGSVGPDGLGVPNYYIDLSELPGCHNSFIKETPSGYRIQNSNISLADFVKQVCSDEDSFRLDYHWKLYPSEITRINQRIEFLSKNIEDDNVVEELNRLNNRLEEIRNSEYFYRYNSPIIKLKTSPRGRKVDNDIHYINQTVRKMQEKGVAINNWSTGLENIPDTTSVLLNGGKKELIVNASNEHFLHIPNQVSNIWNTSSVNTGIYKQVWKMYFGQDRYDYPQIMDGELIYLPINIIDGLPTPTTYYVNYVWLDIYDLKSQLRFFANNHNIIDPDDDIRQVFSENNYRLPEYLKISESELRAAVDFDLFWGTVMMCRGDLYRWFVRVLDASVAKNIIFYNFPSGNSSLENAPIEEVAQQQKVWLYNVLNSQFADDWLNKPGILKVDKQLFNLILEDFSRIYSWVKGKLDEYYGKHYVTPFYFNDVTEMYDDSGQKIRSFVPQETGFRECGGSEWMGLSKQDTLLTGRRGLEVFTEEDGKIHSFLRFYDPLQVYKIKPPRDADGNIIPNGYGNGISPLDSNPGGIKPNEESDIELTYIINTINTTDMDLSNIVRTDDYLYYKVSSVDWIRYGNLVHITVDNPVLGYTVVGGPSAGGASLEPDKWAQMAVANKDILSLDRNLSSQLMDKWEKFNTQVSAAFGLQNIHPKAHIPLDGCYGILCNFIHYGPWIMTNGNGPAKYLEDNGLTPWKYGSQLMDSGEAQERMNAAGVLEVLQYASTRKYGEIEENGMISTGGYPDINLGDEISLLTDYKPYYDFQEHQSKTFGGIYGWMDFGETYTIFSIDEKPYTGEKGPNVTRITCQSISEGNITTNYQMNKYTPKAGMMIKALQDKIELSSNFRRARTQERIERVNQIITTNNKAIKEYINRNKSDYNGRRSDDGGRRTQTRTPHNILMCQFAKYSHMFLDENNRERTVDLTRNKVLTGIDGVDTVQIIRDNETYIEKAFQSFDSLYGGYSTNSIKDGLLLEIEYQKRLAETEGRVLTQIEIENIIAKNSIGKSILPSVIKPTSNSTSSNADGPRFLSEEALDDYNREGILDETQLLPSHPITSEFLNPLVNPANIDNNKLMTNPVGARSRSKYGHTTDIVAKGLSPQDNLDMVASLIEGRNPYNVNYRGIAHTAPFMIQGWGYTTDGKPTPRDTDGATWFSKDFAARKDLWATAPLDIRLHEKRGVWTVPTPRMMFCMLLEDMKIIDISAQNQKDLEDYNIGYAEGATRGNQDRLIQQGNDTGINKPPLPLLGIDEEYLSNKNQIIINAYNEGYNNSFYGITRPNKIKQQDQIIYGKAKVLNAQDNTEYFINIETLAGMPLKKGERVLALRDDAKDKYICVNTGITINKGVVTAAVEPTIYYDKPDQNGNILSGGGWAATDDGEIHKVYCDLVINQNDTILEGNIVQWININGLNVIIGKKC